MKGGKIYSLIKALWPVCRSITGDGVRKTLKIIQKKIPDLKIVEVPSGTKCFDWEIPKEWNIRDAYILDPEGSKIIDFRKSNLHVVSYSIAVDKELSLSDLQKHLHSIKDYPNAIPYVTSYYNENWGFCMTHNQRKTLKEGKYRVVIDSSLEPGHMTFGELIIKGRSKNEVLISTYICHPSMANNELSGPSLTTYLCRYIKKLKPKYTYRIIFIPETIGSIYYLSQNIDYLKPFVFAGLNINCVGDNNNWSFLPTKNGNSYIDRLVRRILDKEKIKFKEFSFLERGSDERQYCSPGIDLPVCSVMRSKFNTFDEYHTSLDNLEFISKIGLQKSFVVYCKILDQIENDIIPFSQVKAEPMMSKRGLRSSIGKRGSSHSSKILMDFLMYSDGKNNLEEIARIINCKINEAKEVLDILEKYGLIKSY
mgnify:CR=1 FL=1